MIKRLQEIVTFVPSIQALLKKESFESGKSFSQLINEIVSKYFKREDLLIDMPFRKPKAVKTIIHTHELPTEPIQIDLYRKQLNMTKRHFKDALDFLIEGKILILEDDTIKPNKEYKL